jgi:tripartite-type tricarboxylate transporter receptor subunit TctC
MVAVAQATGIKVKHVPFQGGPAAVTAVIGGHVDIVSGDNTNPEIRPLVTTHPSRTKYFPDTPTMKDLGYDVEMVVRNMVIAPAGMPGERVKTLVAALEKAVKKPTYQGLMTGINMDLMFEDSEQLAKTWQQLDQKYEKLIESLGLAYYQKKSQ